MSPTVPRKWVRRPYAAATALVALLALVGFWPTYYAPLLAGSVQEPSLTTPTPRCR